MEVILHIGMPKTGTTAIQGCLSRNREVLLQYGILFPRGAFSSSHTELSAALRGERELSGIEYRAYEANPELRHKHYRRLLKRISRNALSIEIEKVVLSHEGLINCANRKKLERFERKLRNSFDKIRTIVYVRDPSAHYISAVQQKLKYRSRIPKYYGRKYRKIERFMQIYDQTIVRKFQRNGLCRGDVISDFLACVSPESPELVEAIGPWTANGTMSAEAMDVLQNVRKAHFFHEEGKKTKRGSAFVRALNAADSALEGFTRPELLPSSRDIVVSKSVDDLLWPRKAFGVEFENIDLSSLPERNSDVEAPQKVSDICLVNFDRRDALSEQVYASCRTLNVLP